MVTDAEPRTTPLISVCVCTYRRPKLLDKLLQCLQGQATNGLFDYSIVIVDNDACQSARSVVERWAERLSVPVTYGVEPQQNIALARNASVRLATGELMAFVDDDEEPSSDWLRKLYEVLVDCAADGVLGPVVPVFEKGAPTWAVKGRVFQRPACATGEAIHWKLAGTGNALVKREVLLESDGPFRPQFGAGGEDRDYFRRAMSRGRVFVWSAEAVCYEPIPLERTRVTIQIRRALLRGKLALHGPEGNWRGILKSAVALFLYAVALPVCLVLGTPVFVTYLVSSCDHLGKLLAACGIDVAGDKYIA
jgi:glycosyltransferase involved in cell wall biosynthesis